MYNRRQGVIVALAIIVALAGIVFMSLAPREPSYNGKSLSNWLDEYNQAGKIEGIVEANAAIRAMGTNALPQLLSNLSQTDPPTIEKLFRLLAKQPIVKARFLDRGRMIPPSILAFKQLGANARPAITQLSQLLENDRTLWRGLTALYFIGPEAIPALEQACLNLDNERRIQAALFLARLNDGITNTWSWGWRTSPASGQPLFSLGDVVTEMDSEALTKALSHTNPVVRQACADALNRYKRPATMVR